jgi:hypothetical protein
MRFYLQSAFALLVLLFITTLMTPSPALTALRGGICFGLALAALKMILRHNNISWPRKRN